MIIISGLYHIISWYPYLGKLMADHLWPGFIPDILDSWCSQSPSRCVCISRKLIGHNDTGWWFQPLWKIWKSVGMIIPNIWKNIPNVPNHQSDNDIIFRVPGGRVEKLAGWLHWLRLTPADSGTQTHTCIYIYIEHTSHLLVINESAMSDNVGHFSWYCHSRTLGLYLGLPFSITPVLAGNPL